MKILVTGAAGFIGFHLVKRLLQEANVSIVGIDNINDYYDTNLKYARLAECGISVTDDSLTQSTSNTNYHFKKLDLTDDIALTALFREENFDYVINAAAQAGVRHSIENPQVYIQSNLLGFANLLENCRQFKIKHFVYLSSSSIYGMNNEVPYKESSNTDYPISLYAATKKSNELMAHSYSHLYKLPTTALRLFSVYGPWGRPDMAPILFAKNILEEKPIKIFNNGNMRRDFTYVADIVESIARITNVIPDENLDHPFYRILNIGNSSSINLLDFVKTLETEIGKDAILEMTPMQPGDVMETYADTQELEKLIHFRPSTPIEVGVKHFIDWYKEFYGYTTS